MLGRILLITVAAVVLWGVVARASPAESGRGSRPDLSRHIRSGAEPAAGARGTAAPAGRRAAADRLRRRHPAAADALDDRPPRAPRGLHHPLPRRPLPRSARDAEDVRPPRPRAADH